MPAPDDAIDEREAAPAWSKVEVVTSYFLMAVLLAVIATRLCFATVWQLPAVDLVLSAAALVLLIAALWVARRRRGWRIAVIVFAASTQLVPMVVRHPALLFPLLAAFLPVLILFGALFALSRKGATAIRPRRR